MTLSFYDKRLLMNLNMAGLFRHIFLHELRRGEDFQLPLVGMSEIVDINGDDQITAILHGALVLEAVLYVGESLIAYGSKHFLAGDASHFQHSKHRCQQ